MLIVLQPKPALHTKEIYEKLVALDVISLSAQLTILVTDDMQYKRLVVRRGDAAQALLDLLQAVRMPPLSMIQLSQLFIPRVNFIAAGFPH